MNATIESNGTGECPQCKKAGSHVKSRPFESGEVHLYACETDNVRFYGPHPNKPTKKK
jgi:hypothetical protein